MLTVLLTLLAGLVVVAVMRNKHPAAAVHAAIGIAIVSAALLGGAAVQVWFARRLPVTEMATASQAIGFAKTLAYAVALFFFLRAAFVGRNQPDQQNTGTDSVTSTATENTVDAAADDNPYKTPVSR